LLASRVSHAGTRPDNHSLIFIRVANAGEVLGGSGQQCYDELYGDVLLRSKMSYLAYSEARFLSERRHLLNIMS